MNNRVVYHQLLRAALKDSFKLTMASAPQQIREDALIEELREIVGDENVLSEPEELLVYECDGLPQHKHPPRAVVFPNSTEETSEVLEVLSDEGVSFAPRGAGTGLSGGALAINRGVVIELARMRKLLRIDTENRLAVVQTGLVNAQLSRAVAPYGLYYVPDPSSQPACTIGGNIAENAGGIHCLKYGTTTDHVVGVRVVLSDGSIVDLDVNSPGYDLQLANVFHAGDGNLRPLICFELRRGDDLEKVRQAGREIMETCVRAGGSITGEHGVGLDKSSYLPLIFSQDDMEAMLAVRA